MRPDADLSVLNAEIRKQYDNQLQIDNSLDAKLAIILGFNILVLAELLLTKALADSIIHNISSTRSNFNLLNPEIYSLVLLILGLAALSLSLYIGVRAYSIKRYWDVELQDYVDLYKKQERWIDYETDIAKLVFENYKNGYEKAQRKAANIRRMVYCFSFGLIMFFFRFALIILSNSSV